MTDLSIFSEFPPGTLVTRKNNPTVTGTVTNNEPIVLGKKVKIFVQWSTGDKAPVSTKLLCKVVQSDAPVSALEALNEGNYGHVEDLRNGLLGYRLAGTISDLLYSYGITNTQFLSYQFKPLLTFFSSPSNSLLIADEVGLGKTIEAGLIWTELRMRQQAQRLLVVCPAQLCEKWQAELSDKFGVEAAIVGPLELSSFISKFCLGKVRSGALIVSLQSIRPPKNWENWSEEEINAKPRAALSHLLQGKHMRDDVFNLFILDEAHHIRNDQTQSHEIVADLRAVSSATVFLSATPIQNSNRNLYSLLHVLDPHNYPYESILEMTLGRNKPLIELISEIANKEISVDRYRRMLKDFMDVQYGHVRAEVEAMMNEPMTNEDLKNRRVRSQLIKRLEEFNPLSQILTRTLKRYVLTDNRIVRRATTKLVTLTPVELAYYQSICDAIREECQFDQNGWQLVLSTYQRILSSSLAASHQAWAQDSTVDEEAVQASDIDLEETEEETTKPSLASVLQGCAQFYDYNELVNNDSKFKALVKVLDNLKKEEGSCRMVIFSFFKATLRYLENRLKMAGYSCARIDGDIDRSDRHKIVDAFKKGAFDILLSSEVAAEGVDLQFVSTLVNYDLPWNPAKVEQRIGRIDRIGQKAKAITIINFAYEGTIEQRICQSLFHKLRLFEEALGVSEAVLGKEIKRMTLNLFSRKLTAKEETAIIEQTAMALENEKSTVENVRGQSQLFDLLSGELEATQRLERFILDDDIRDYVQWFCDKGPGKSRLFYPTDDSDSYRIVLSPESRALFQHFLNETDSKLETTSYFLNPDLKFRFKNKQGYDEPGIERVTQNHPLIRFITHWRAKEKQATYPTSSIKYEPSAQDLAVFGNVPDGDYAYCVQYWEFRTEGMARSKAKLAFRAYNIETGSALDPDDAEALITKAARFGKTLHKTPPELKASLCDYASEADDELSEQHDVYVQKAQAEALRECTLKRQNLVAELERIRHRHEATLKNMGEETAKNRGLRKILEKRFEGKREELQTRIAAAEMTKKEAFNDSRTVSMGHIRLRRP